MKETLLVLDLVYIRGSTIPMITHGCDKLINFRKSHDIWYDFVTLECLTDNYKLEFIHVER
ncbi:hypothetical protein J2X77_001733 [Sphingobacterium sp. 2149]|nr:hypothetical protein [Sphingobacterium sp. 2149]